MTIQKGKSEREKEGKAYHQEIKQSTEPDLSSMCLSDRNF